GRCRHEPPARQQPHHDVAEAKNDDVDYVASAVSCTPGYFQALGIRLVKGRFFTAADDAQHPAVIIVSATTARRLFGTDDPIGQTFTVPKFQYRLVLARMQLSSGLCRT